MAPLGAGKVGLFAAAGAGAAGTGAGYFGGGLPGPLDTVESFSFPSDSRTTLVATLSAARYKLAGMADSGTAGYFAGGSGSAVVDKLAFSDETMSTLGTGMPSNWTSAAGFANSGTAGYVGGGEYWSAGSVYVTTVDKFAFSDDSRTTLGTGLTVGTQYNAAFANTSGL